MSRGVSSLRWTLNMTPKFPGLPGPASQSHFPHLFFASVTFILLLMTSLFSWPLTILPFGIPRDVSDFIKNIKAYRCNLFPLPHLQPQPHILVNIYYHLLFRLYIWEFWPFILTLRNWKVRINESQIKGLVSICFLIHSIIAFFKLSMYNLKLSRHSTYQAKELAYLPFLFRCWFAIIFWNPRGTFWIQAVRQLIRKRYSNV